MRHLAVRRLLVLDVRLRQLFLRVVRLHRRHFLLMPLRQRQFFTRHLRLQHRRGFIGANLHVRNRELRLVPHPLDF